MYFIRLFTGVFTIIIFSKIGDNFAKNKKYAYEYCNSFYDFCNMYISELKYSKNTLENFLDKTCFCSDFLSTLKAYVSSGEISLPLYISEVERDKFITFLNLLGKSDSNSQISSMNTFLLEFKTIKQDKFNEYNKYKTFYKKLGFFAGLILLIMVV